MTRNLPISKIDAELLAALKAWAERKNRSVEEEVLDIFRAEYADQPTSPLKTDN